MDFVINGQGHGDVADILMANNFNPNALRPWVGNDGRTYIAVDSGQVKDGKPVFNAVPMTNSFATLRKDDWKQLDQAVIKAAKPRLRVFADLRAAGLTYTMANGMGKTVLEYEKLSDVTPASVSMDGLDQTDGDRPKFELAGLPLPIIHKDFQFSARQLMASRNGGSPLDTTSAELAGRRVAEEVEKMTLGNSTVADQYAFAGYTIYGLTDHPARLTKTLTAPDGGSWTGATLVSEILAMKAQSQAAYHYGPWMIYNSPNWDQYLDDDYSSSKGDNTTRERITKISGIQGCRTADYMTGFDLVMVQMTSNVIRGVIGMDITTVQWESVGGLRKHFKVMAILVPQLRDDINDRTGIVHGSATSATTTTAAPTTTTT